jgi:hypothetical protein
MDQLVLLTYLDRKKDRGTEEGLFSEIRKRSVTEAFHAPKNKIYQSAEYFRMCFRVLQGYNNNTTFKMFLLGLEERHFPSLKIKIILNALMHSM